MAVLKGICCLPRTQEVELAVQAQGAPGARACRGCRGGKCVGGVGRLVLHRSRKAIMRLPRLQEKSFVGIVSLDK